MSQSEQETDKSEDATPFKLRKAREKGQVARGTDLAFFSTLIALFLFVMLFGASAYQNLKAMMAIGLSSPVNSDAPQQAVLIAISLAYPAILQILLILGALVAATVILFEIIQLRGPVFSTHPLKPDFNRLNPAKGLKRIFSGHTLKNALKNILKMILYSGATGFVIWTMLRLYFSVPRAGTELPGLLILALGYLLGACLLIAAFVAIIDQVVSRQDFRKQMRMSKREVKREIKDREGDPRIKKQRQKTHAEFTKANQGLSNLANADLLIVNPTHYAIALKYDSSLNSAPLTIAKGRGKVAAYMRKKCLILGKPIVHSPKLARNLFDNCEIENEVGPDLYLDVARLYRKHVFGVG